MLVTMTHEDRPGVEETVEQVAYRYTWYALGWRSEDDPDWEGAGVTATRPHASDETIHGAGQLLARAWLSADSATMASATPLVIAELSITFVCPARPYTVRAQGRLHPVDSAAIAQLQIYAQIGAGSATLQAVDGHRAATANDLKNCKIDLPVPGPAVVSPNSPDWHKPTPGEQVTYGVRIARPGGTGNISLSVDNALLGKAPTFIEAVTV